MQRGRATTALLFHTHRIAPNFVTCVFVNVNKLSASQRHILDSFLQRTQLLAYLGLLDTSHVLPGQAGAEQGLLWVLCVALEHLRLQLSTQRPGVTGSGQGNTRQSDGSEQKSGDSASSLVTSCSNKSTAKAETGSSCKNSPSKHFCCMSDFMKSHINKQTNRSCLWLVLDSHDRAEIVSKSSRWSLWKKKINK